MISASLVKELRDKTGAGMLDCKKALEANEGNIEKSIDWLREKGISKAAKKADRIAADGIAQILVNGNTAVIIEINSETDFVAKNTEFTDMVNEIAEVICNSTNTLTSIEDVLALNSSEGTINELIINKTAKIGEKLSLRRFEKITKNDNQSFGSYIHMGGKIAVLTLLNNSNDEVSKEIAMHAAAMRPIYTKVSEVPTTVVEHELEIIKEQLINEGKDAKMVEGIANGKIKKFYEEVCLENQMFIKDNKKAVKDYIKESTGGNIETMIRFEVGEGMEKREENFAEEVQKQINNN